VDKSDSPAVEQIVARFFEQRRQGKRVSIDDVLSASVVDGDRRQTRAAALRIVVDRVHSSRASLHATDIPVSAVGAEPALPDLEGYDLIDELGRGGMGIVYEAYQRSTGRRVAVKVMSELAAASESGRRRFEREVELVARLQHPGIVAIIDSGVNRGRFFFVMEYIDGQPLDRALADASDDARRAMSMLADVADAVDYAHQRGVLHRDLKPSNILVDAAGRPHVLDFGLAKAIDPGSNVSRGLTQDGPNRLLGTLAYMSPEQSRGELTKLSVRSDVYSLGAIGYELATGRLPCDVDGPLAEVLQRIASTDPAPPSAVQRPDRSLTATDDIDAILLKALEKDPQQRYATAGDLAADIRRFLADEPVAARPISTWYQLRKFARRNRALVGGVTAAALLLVVGAAGTTWQAVRATRAERRAVAERDRALQAADRATQVTRFVQRMLAMARPGQAKGRETSVREILDRASQAVAKGLPFQPRTTAALRYTIGLSYLQLGMFSQAEPHLEAALAEQRANAGESDVELFDTLLALAQLRMEQNRPDEAEKLINEASRLPGIAEAASGKKPYELLTRLAVFQARKGNAAETTRLFREALRQVETAATPDDGLIAGATMNLAGAMEDSGDRATAEKLYRQAIERFRRAGGDDSPDVALASYNLAIFLHNQDRLKEAEPLYREALRIRRKVLPPTHPELAETTASLGGVLREDGRPVEAEPLLRESLEIFRASLPAGHPNIAKSEGFLGKCLVEMGRYSDAEPLLRSALAKLQGGPDEDQARTQQLLKCLVAALDGQGKNSEAEQFRARVKPDPQSKPAP